MDNWIISEFDRDQIGTIAEGNDISAFLAMLLYTRGISEGFDIDCFLSDEIDLRDPFEFKDMYEAVCRINKALDDEEKICIFGDYDADGVTATSILYLYLQRRQAKGLMYYISDRETEGYGMNKQAIKKLFEQGINLIITVDNGISAIEEIDYAKELGVDIVVTDHHQLKKGEIPKAAAVVNPHRPDCMSEFKDYAGVGVAFKLICALEGEELNYNQMLDKYGDLVAIGTIADIVPLKDENRAIVKWAIEHIKSTDNIGLKCLLHATGVSDDEITSTKLAFRLIPKINVTGRLENADKAVDLLLTNDEQYAKQLADELINQNSERQQMDMEIVDDIDAMIAKDPNILQNRLIIVANEGWHAGVIGIAASRIVKKYSKPCVIISKDKEESVASCRSVEGFSIYEALYNCRELLNKFGGHPMAAGFSVDTDKIDTFKLNMEKYAENANRYMPYNKIEISCKFNPKMLNLDLIDDIRQLEPFGMLNANPVLGLFNMRVLNITPLSGGKHTKITVEKNGTQVEVLKFGDSPEELEITNSDVIDLAVTLGSNTFRGNTTLSIMATGIKFSEIDNDRVLEDNRIYECFLRGEKLSNDEIELLLPSRDDCVCIYKYLRNNKEINVSTYALLHRLANKELNIAKLNIILDMFEEAKLIDRVRKGKYNKIKVNKIDGKVDLMSSPILNSLE